MVSALISILVYGALFGPILVVVLMIITYLNERNQAEIEFHRTLMEKHHLQSALREAELKQLYAQIKPHFLFNTLNTIRSSVMLGRRDEAMAVVEALSYSFRYALQKSGLIVPLRDELKYLHSYLEIQKTRFGGRIVVDLRVEDQLAEIGVPYLSVQTLVENAVEHGVEQKPGPTYISVEIVQDGENLLVTVTDDGVGTSEPINVDIISLEEDHPLLGGIGLRNIRERLQLHFPGRSSLRFTGAPGQGCKVQMHIPALPHAEAGQRGDVLAAGT